MASGCQGTNAAGEPCSAKPVLADGWCYWHSPARANERAENNRKGGKARSNQARASKELGGALSSNDLLVTLSRAIKKVEAGKLDPGPANAIAGLARAMNSIREATEIERRLEALETAAEQRWRA